MISDFLKTCTKPSNNFLKLSTSEGGKIEFSKVSEYALKLNENDVAPALRNGMVKSKEINKQNDTISFQI